MPEKRVFELNSDPSEKRFLRWRMLGRVALFFLSCAVVLAVTVPLTRKVDGPWQSLVAGTIASLGAFVLTVLFVKWERLRLENVGARFSRRSLPRFFFGFLAGLLLVTLFAALLTIGGHVRWVRAPGAGFAGIAFMTYVALSCREELAFRGFPLRRLEQFFGLWVAQGIVAFVFAAEHVAGGVPWSRALLGAGMGSLLFGMAAIATRGLAIPVGLHAAWNFGDWMLGGKDSAGVWAAVAEEGYQGRMQLVRTVAYLAVTGFATFAFWMWHRRMNAGESLG